jgi:transcriptional regulator GlxA family with amidase domain
MKNKTDAFQLFGIQRYLDLLVLEFFRNVSASELTTNSSLNNITRAIQYIQQHLDENLSVNRLADICRYSPAYFTRTFKKTMGQSPKSYIIDLRIEQVLHLVSTKNLTIMDAAYKSGFHASSTFYKTFNAYKSTSPLKYLKNIR